MEGPEGRSDTCVASCYPQVVQDVEKAIQGRGHATCVGFESGDEVRAALQYGALIERHAKAAKQVVVITGENGEESDWQQKQTSFLTELGITFQKMTLAEYKSQWPADEDEDSAVTSEGQGDETTLEGTLQSLALENPEMKELLEHFQKNGNLVGVRKMEFKSLIDATARALARILPACTQLIHLDLSDNNLGESVAKELAKVLPACPKLGRLYLGNNNFGEAGNRKLMRVLPDCAKLTLLSLGGNNLGEVGARDLAQVLPSCTTLTELWLYDNNLGHAGARELEGVLPVCVQLQELWLYDNKLSQADEEALQGANTMLAITF